MSFIQVLLPLSLNWLPTYRTDEKLAKGQFVSVAFSNKTYIGIVWDLDVQPAFSTSKIKSINRIENDIPAVSENEMKLWEFVASYYLCSLSDVLRLSYPSFRSKGDKQEALRIEELRERISLLETKVSERQSSPSARLKASVTEKLIAQKQDLEYRLNNLISREQVSITPRSKQKPVLVRASFEKRSELYVTEIHAALENGGQVLLLCPDLSFSSRLELILKEEFEDYLYLANYKTSNSNRFKIASALRSGSPCLILGTKNAIFLPYRNLSLIIIDEEQDSSYKNNESNPRFNARDCAVYLSSLHNSKTLLCASMPSLESYNNWKENKYTALKLIDNQNAANITVVDINEQKRKRAMVEGFCSMLISRIDKISGTVVIIRTWEKPDNIDCFVKRRFPGKDIKILTIGELKRSLWLRPRLIAVLSADGLLSKDDFRSDEKALQIASLLCDFAPSVILQTTVPSRFNSERGLDVLLEERRAFNYPPFTRMVAVCDRITSGVVNCRFFARNADLSEEKRLFFTQNQSPSTYFDVDPLMND